MLYNCYKCYITIICSLLVIANDKSANKKYHMLKKIKK